MGNVSNDYLRYKVYQQNIHFKMTYHTIPLKFSIFRWNVFNSQVTDQIYFNSVCFKIKL